MKLKKGDEIIVTAGKDKGKRGKIEEVLSKLDKVVVAGVNVYKRHRKRQSEQKAGGIIDLVKPLPVANVAFMCPKCKKPTRIGYEVSSKEKHRICRKCKQMV